MSDSNQHARQNKPWYKKWWGIILAIIIWPFFLTWFTWSKTKWRKLAKVGATLAIGIASLISLSVMAAGQPQPVDTPKSVAATQSSSSNSKPAKQATTQPTKTTPTPTPKTTPAPTPQPTVSLAALESQGKATLTTATKRFEDYYAKVQSDAAQSDASNSSSAFNSDKWNSDLTPLNQATKDYDTVSNSYYNAHQTQPASLDTWNTDSQQVYTDTNNWVRDEWQLLADQTQSNPTDNDQAKVDADVQVYNTDLAKTNTDINQL